MSLRVLGLQRHVARCDVTGPSGGGGCRARPEALSPAAAPAPHPGGRSRRRDSQRQYVPRCPAVCRCVVGELVSHHKWLTTAPDLHDI
ncbi:hypothetical protein EVAR_95216_1 [Eumeta japonica]|uniref:Uncharacterized protein n=1 Tax=Eumeta variegata TaxID=151549 RepID=A0A4C1VG15_EUMVA|nr:hypothetical protein EVAR_95216_1 [Eumeta japonica]